MQTFSFRTNDGTLITTTDFHFFLALLKMEWERKKEAAIKRQAPKETKTINTKSISKKEVNQ